ncbi:unnamed protein product [Rhizophagus irregularis]|nr:unnamed protein product [Rhizophagus irregularis]CAB5205450.1 unnamed protein product [Rhizophagus irregularis]
MEEITFPCNKAGLTPVRPARENMSLQNITGIHSTVSVSLKPPVSFRNVLDFSASCNGAQVVQRLSGWLQLQGCLSFQMRKRTNFDVTGSKEVGTDFFGVSTAISSDSYRKRYWTATFVSKSFLSEIWLW